MSGELIPRIVVRDKADRDFLMSVVAFYHRVSLTGALICPCSKGDFCENILDAKKSVELLEALADDEVASAGDVPDTVPDELYAEGGYDS